MQWLAIHLLLPFSIQAQSNQTVTSTIEKVTVYFDGAQITRNGMVTLPSGKSEVVFTRLSPLLVKETVQLSMGSDVSILGIQVRQPENRTQLSEKERAIQDKIGQEKLLLSNDSLALSILRFEETVLEANKTTGGNPGNTKIADLKQTMDYFRSKITEIRNRQLELLRSLSKRESNISQLRNELMKAGYRSSEPFELVANISSKKGGLNNFHLQYYVKNAGWEPSYDIRVTNVISPLNLKWKARIFQATQEDWKNVKISLSNHNPDVKSQLQEIKPYYLNQGYGQTLNVQEQKGYLKMIKGKVVDANNEPVIGATISVFVEEEIAFGTTSDLEGKFQLTVEPKSLQKIQISSLGYSTSTFTTIPHDEIFRISDINYKSEHEVVMADYGKGLNVWGNRSGDKAVFINGVRQFGTSLPPAEPIMGISQSYNLNTSQVEETRYSTTVSYDIKEPYTIPADGKEINVDIFDMDIKADFQYISIPKINPNAYLVASLPDWEELNLLEGEASVYYENTFTGQTFIDVSKGSDTLKLSLGADKQISVSRTKIRSNSKKQVLGNTRTATREFEFKVRNNKNIPVPITIIDQFPVSSNSDVVVDKTEKSGAELTEWSGLLQWKFSLEPGKEKKWPLIYKVKYPGNIPVYLE